MKAKPCLSVGFVFAFLMCGTAAVHSKAAAVQNRNLKGIPVKFSSDILKEERMLSISLPADYENSDKAFPVLYILDAEAGNTFSNAAAAVEDLSDAKTGPQMIVVGIRNTNRNRDMIPAAVSHRPGSGGSFKFLQFFREELQPFIRREYRTEPFSILYGASNAGLFTVYALLEDSNIFHGYIASSPMIGHCPDLIGEKSRIFLQRTQAHNRFLFIIYGTEDSRRVTQFAPDFKRNLVENGPADFFCRLEILEGEGHVPGDSLIRGLKYIFTHRAYSENYRRADSFQTRPNMRR